MPKFRRRPLEIEAEQWFPGKEIKGVTLRPVEIIYSRDGAYYYISNYASNAKVPMATVWLSVEKLAEPPSLDQWLAAGIEIKTGDGEHYFRQVLPFAFYEVKSGERAPAEANSDEYKDYGAYHKWEEHPRPNAFVTTIHNQKVFLEPGDWVIPESDGEHYYPVKPDVFEATYEPV